MRFSAEACVQKVLKAYDAASEEDRERSGVPLATFVLKAGVNANELIGAVVMAFRSLQAQKSGLIALKNHPRVLAHTVHYSQFPDQWRDRQMIHQAVGFLPTSHGSSINVNFPQKPEAARNEDGVTAPDVNEVFPMISDRLPAWQTARQKALKASEE